MEKEQTATQQHDINEHSHTQNIQKNHKKSNLPNGFFVSGIKANIKYKNRYDLALIYSPSPCVGAGVWTKNSMQAACIIYNKAHIQNKIHAVMINSGYANACTSIQGDKNCLSCANSLAQSLKIQPTNILLSSTGVIGEQLPMNRILKAIPKLVSTKDRTKNSLKHVSKAIMTTDTYPKVYSTKLFLQDSIIEKAENTNNESANNESLQQDKKAHKKKIEENKKKSNTQGIKIKIWGMAKGSGMIHPNMATMLGFVLTDVAIKQNLLQEALSEVVQQSFNQISVDGDTSTNDMVIVLANGEAKNKEITEKNQDYEAFKSKLRKVCINLAKKVARDGEGATHFLEVVVKNAKTLQQAQKLSKAVISSNLVKTAIFGKDANWGRIICAMGYSETEFDSTKLNLSFESKKGKITITENGVGLKFSESKAKNILSASKVRIVVNLNDGKECAKAWGCDLSYGYIKINADYRS